MGDDSQDIVSFHINIAELEAEKLQALAIFEELFAGISKYDNSKVSPVKISGLTELNTNISKTTKSLDALNKSIGKFNTLVTQTTTNTNRLNTATNKLTGVSKEEQTILDNNIRLQNKINALTSDAAKKNAELTLELKQKNQALKEEAESINTVIQEEKRLQAEEEENLKIKKQEIADLKALNKQKKEDEQQRIASEKAAKKEAAAILLENDAYKQLKLQIKEKEAAYANSVLQNGGNPNNPQSKGLLSDLENDKSVVNKIEGNLGNAGVSGAEKLGKALSSQLSIIRQIAYILPGIGLAGIFNLAFESLSFLIQQFGVFDDKLQRTIDYEKALAEYIGKLNALLLEQAENYRTVGSEGVNFYERLKSLNEASGVSYEGQLKQIDDFNKAHKDAVDAFVTDTKSSYKELGKLNGDLATYGEQRKKITDKILDVEEKLNAKRNEKVPIQGFIQRSLEKAGQVSGLESLKEDLDNELSLFDEKAKTDKDRAATIKSALDDQIKANIIIDEEVIKRQLYFYNEQRRIRLDDTKRTVSDIISNNQTILNSEKSSLEDRIKAIAAIYQANVKEIKAQRDFVLSDRGASSADKNQAITSFQSEKVQLLNSYNSQIEKVTADFEKRDLKAQDDYNTQRIEAQEQIQESLYKNEVAGLDYRLDALKEYISLRKSKIDGQYNYEKSLEGYAFKTPEEQQALETNRSSQTTSLEADVANKVREITLSYGNQRLKQLKDENKAIDENNDLEDEYISKLAQLSVQLVKGSISWKSYNNAKEALNNKFNATSATERIDEDKQKIENAQRLLEDINQKIEGANADKNTAAEGGDSKAVKNAEAEQKALVEIRLKTLDELKLLSDQLDKDEIDEAKKKAIIIEQGQKILAENEKKLRQETSALAIQLIEQEEQKRILAAQKEEEIRNKQRDGEKDAIQKSSLSAKDKAALEIQLTQQKALDEIATQRRINKSKHDAAVLEKAIAEASILWDTERAVASALKIPYIGEALAISYAALGAVALAKVAATPVPAYRFGTPPEGHAGGLARYAEGNIPEVIHEPGKNPRIATRETVSFLSEGTHVYPMYDIPSISDRSKSSGSWEQTRWLGAQFRKSNKEIKNIVRTSLTINLSFAEYKRSIINN